MFIPAKCKIDLKNCLYFEINSIFQAPSYTLANNAAREEKKIYKDSRSIQIYWSKNGQFCWAPLSWLSSKRSRETSLTLASNCLTVRVHIICTSWVKRPLERQMMVQVEISRYHNGLIFIFTSILFEMSDR